MKKESVKKRIYRLRMKLGAVLYQIEKIKIQRDETEMWGENLSSKPDYLLDFYYSQADQLAKEILENGG